MSVDWSKCGHSQNGMHYNEAETVGVGWDSATGELVFKDEVNDEFTFSKLTKSHVRSFSLHGVANPL